MFAPYLHISRTEQLIEFTGKGRSVKEFLRLYAEFGKRIYRKPRKVYVNKRLMTMQDVGSAHTYKWRSVMDSYYDQQLECIKLACGYETLFFLLESWNYDYLKQYAHCLEEKGEY